MTVNKIVDAIRLFKETTQKVHAIVGFNQWLRHQGETSVEGLFANLLLEAFQITCVANVIRIGNVNTLQAYQLFEMREICIKAVLVLRLTGDF